MESAVSKSLHRLRIHVGLLAALLAVVLTGCGTPPVSLLQAEAGGELAPWASSVSRVTVGPVPGPFYQSSGVVTFVAPRLSPNAAAELAEAIERSIVAGGGETGVQQAPELRIEIIECGVRWDAVGMGVDASAVVRLRGTIDDPRGGRLELIGSGSTRRNFGATVLPSSAQPMISSATSEAVRQLLGATGLARRDREAPEAGARSGTGFFVSPEGHIATAAHVVPSGSKVQVLVNGQSLPASILARSDALDLALLKVDAASPGWLALASRESLQLGDDVFTIGFPVIDLLDAQPVYSEGVISALTGVGGDASLLQTSVPIQPGNSGGPLVTSGGEVAGVITSTAAVARFLRTTGTLPQNLNWAVRAELLRSITGVNLNAVPPNQSLAEGELVSRIQRSVVRVVAE